MEKNIVCISGNIAVGKSEVARLVAEKLGFELYKASAAFRECARRNNMDLVTFNEYVKNNPDIDRKIEETTKEIVDSKDNVIVDARLGFYIEPKAFKVYLTADVGIAAERLFEASKTRGKEEEYITVEDAKHAIELREASERERYIKLYNIDIHDLSNYDIVIDTTKLTSTEVADKIIAEYNKK